MRSHSENLRLYAQLTLREGLGLANGQELLVFAEHDQAPFVRLIVEEAYRAGAKHVEVFYRDSEIVKARFREGSDEAIGYAPQWFYDGITQAHRANAARLGILSADPALLSSFPAERVAASSKAQSQAAKELSDLVSEFAINWCLVGASSPEWAKRVFPDSPELEAVAKLWEKIFLSCRVLEDDPLTAWAAHSQTLEAKVAWLNDLRLDALHFRGPGTDLRVGLVENHEWAGGSGVAKNGIRCCPNIPTEEVFTMPHRDRVDGTVRSTKPLSLRGQVLTDIQMEFRDGVAVKATAATGDETLQKLLATDDGAKRLGEVALVPQSSKVSQTGVLFFNSLYDENAACHIAMGASYSENLPGSEALSEDEQAKLGANSSLIHVDWMIGSSSLDVDGVRADGTALPLMRSGEWV